MLKAALKHLQTEPSTAHVSVCGTLSVFDMIPTKTLPFIAKLIRISIQFISQGAVSIFYDSTTDILFRFLSI